MIRSMTGFAEAALDRDELRANVSVRALNHRFFDLTLHLPRRLQPLEAEARERVKAAVGRGRVEVSLSAALPADGPEAVAASRPLVASLVRTLRDMQNEFGLDGGVSVADLVRFPGALDVLERAREAHEVGDRDAAVQPELVLHVAQRPHQRRHQRA